MVTFLFLSGLLVGYTLGNWFTWRDVAFLSSGVALLPLLLTCMFSAESPEWLLSKGNKEEALQTLQFLTDDASIVSKGRRNH
jgi:Sugar (and other) transporter.